MSLLFMVLTRAVQGELEDPLPRWLAHITGKLELVWAGNPAECVGWVLGFLLTWAFPQAAWFPDSTEASLQT